MNLVARAKRGIALVIGLAAATWVATSRVRRRRDQVSDAPADDDVPGPDPAAGHR